jgi:flagellar motor switch protein FliG
MNNDRTERIRRAAILVASLEAPLAEQMLSVLPRQEAAKIEAMVERLGEVDAEEQRDVLEEFRRAGRQKGGASAVEFTYSAPPTAVRATATAEAPQHGSPASGEPSLPVNEDDARLMAELLGQEHPQTIAAALSRLGREEGAAVFAALPAALQMETLDRLAQIEPGDEGAVEELHAELRQRIERHRARRTRAAAAAEMARQMLDRTAPETRAALLARLQPSAPRLAIDAADADRSQPMAQQARILATAVHRAKSALPAEPFSAPEPVAPPRERSESIESPTAIAEALEDCSAELESLADDELVEVLRAADERTVQLALAASSERFFRRVAGRFPRRQAARLRSLVRNLAPASVSQMRAAQHELLQLARRRAAVPTPRR